MKLIPKTNVYCLPGPVIPSSMVVQLSNSIKSYIQAILKWVVGPNQLTMASGKLLQTNPQKRYNLTAFLSNFL